MNLQDTFSKTTASTTPPFILNSSSNITKTELHTVRVLQETLPRERTVITVFPILKDGPNSVTNNNIANISTDDVIFERDTAPDYVRMQETISSAPSPRLAPFISSTRSPANDHHSETDSSVTHESDNVSTTQRRAARRQEKQRKEEQERLRQEELQEKLIQEQQKNQLLLEEVRRKKMKATNRNGNNASAKDERRKELSESNS